MARIAVIGDYDPASLTHGATDAALQHSSQQLGAQLEHTWLSTQSLSDALFDQFAAVWIAPGSPYKDMARTLAAIRFAREHGVPCLGTCGGFQHMILEYARNVLGTRDAQHAEYDPNASELFITPLACSLRGRSMTLQLAEGSQVAALYGSAYATEPVLLQLRREPSARRAAQERPVARHRQRFGRRTARARAARPSVLHRHVVRAAGGLANRPSAPAGHRVRARRARANPPLRAVRLKYAQSRGFRRT